MIQNAKAIGNSAVMEAWKGLCSLAYAWNLDHHPAPFLRASSSRTLPTPPHLSPCSQAGPGALPGSSDRQPAWGRRPSQVHVSSLLHGWPVSRIQDGGKAFCRMSQRMNIVREESPTLLCWNGVCSKAYTHEYAEPQQSCLRSPKQRGMDELSRQVGEGRRWLYLRQETNPGIFALIPDAFSFHRWIEKDLTYDVFCTWVALIQSAISQPSPRERPWCPAYRMRWRVSLCPKDPSGDHGRERPQNHDDPLKLPAEVEDDGRDDWSRGRSSIVPN